MRSRLFVAGLAAAGALVLGACGSGSAGSSSSTILPLTPTNFATIPTVPATTTTTVAPAAGETLTAQTTYVIQSGDYPSTIAQKFGVKFQDLLSLNGWTLSGNQVTNFPAVGTEIKIPAGATQPGAATATATTSASASGATTTTTAGASGATTTTTKSATAKSTTTTTAEASTPTNSAGPCVEGTYTIQKGDIPINVAKKFDLTVDQLNAANANTKGYKAFAVGIKIIIPKGSNCP